MQKRIRRILAAFPAVCGTRLFFLRRVWYNGSMERIACFDPVIGENSRVLILGTMPSVQSLREHFYYAHPRNAFWKIMGEAYGREIFTVEQKRAVILENGLALWDVMRSCKRSGSLDSAIRDPIPNDFAALFERYPAIQRILFNGAKAEECFFRLARTTLGKREALRLPSTSPANTLAFEEKCRIWLDALQQRDFAAKYRAERGRELKGKCL